MQFFDPALDQDLTYVRMCALNLGEDSVGDRAAPPERDYLLGAHRCRWV